MTRKYVFALKDDQENYISENSIRLNSETKKYHYVYSTRLANGFYTYSDKDQALEAVHNLKKLAEKIGFNKEFHYEEFDMKTRLLYENRLLPSEKNPIKNIEIEGIKATTVA